MWNTSTVLGISILAVLTAAPARSQEMSAEAKAFYEKREQYRRTVRDPLRQKVAERRQVLSQEADLKNLHFLIEKARKAYDAIVAGDPEIVAAREAEEAAQKALKDVTEAQLAANADIQAVKAQIETAKEAQRRWDSEGDKLQREIEKFRQEMSKSPEVQEAKRAYEAAQRAYYEIPQKHPKFVAARQAVQTAERALQERIKDLPETKALEQAQKAYSDLQYNSPEIKQARTARDEARQFYQKLLDHVVRASEKGSAMYRSLEEFQRKETEAEAIMEGLTADLYELRRSAEKNDPVIVQARQAYEQAHARHGEVSARRSAAERKALDSARRDLAERLEKKMKLDPILLDLMDRLRKAEKECDDLYAKYRAAREKARTQR